MKDSYSILILAIVQNEINDSEKVYFLHHFKLNAVILDFLQNLKINYYTVHQKIKKLHSKPCQKKDDPKSTKQDK